MRPNRLLITLYLGALLILIQCKSISSTKELKVSGYIYIPKEEGMFFRPLLLKFNQDSLLTFTNNTTTGIHEFNLNTSLLRFIPVHFKPHYTYINQYRFLNDSTLLVSFNEAHLGAQHDSLLLIYNIFSHSKIPYKFDTLNVVMSQNRKNYSESDYLYSMNFPFIFNSDSSIIATAANSKSKLNGNARVFKLYPSSSTNISKELALPDHFEYPEGSNKIHFTPNERKIRGWEGRNGKIIFSYGISNNLIVTDTNFSKIDYIKSHPSTLPKTNGELSKPKEYRNLENIEYEELYYYPKDDFYLRIVRMPSSKENPMSYSYPEHRIIKMDSKFEVQDIYTIPFGLIPPIIPFKDGLLAFDLYQSDKCDSFCFQILDFKSKKGTKKVPPQKENYNLSWQQYLNSIDHNLLGYQKVVLIPIENMCTECIQSMEQFINTIETTNTAVVLIASSEKNINGFIKKHKINPNVCFRDFRGLYKRLGIDMFNFNLLTKTNQDQYTWKRYSNAEIPDLFKILK